MDGQKNFPVDRFVIYEKLVRRNFFFLEESYGFKFSEIEKNDNKYIKLKYVSEKVFLSLYYGPPGFELDFSIGRLGVEDKADKHSFTSGDLLYLENFEKWKGYKIFSAHSYDNLCSCLPKLAQLLEECGKACLQGCPLAYEKMLFEQKKDANRWCKIQKVVQTRKFATEAWVKKDYAGVVDCLNSIINELTLSEYKKLAYSHKKLSKEK